MHLYRVNDQVLFFVLFKYPLAPVGACFLVVRWYIYRKSFFKFEVRVEFILKSENESPKAKFMLSCE